MIANRQKVQDLHQTIARRIKEFRMIAGLTQEQLSERVDIAPQYLSRLETCRRFPSLALIAELADALNTTPSALLAKPEQEVQAERASRVVTMFSSLTEKDAAFLESELRNWIDHLSEHPQ
jgi:transcriptional regulator with XRE-family HTH domain